jgi:protein SCO1/2
MRHCAASLVLLLVWAGPGIAAVETPPVLDEAMALERSQAAIGRTLSGYHFTDSEGNPLAIESLRGRPLVLSLVYTSCHHTCPTITRRVREVVTIARDALGDGAFNVVTVGFDTSVDTPAQMHDYGRSQGVGDAHWRLLSADAGNMARLVEDLGFTYVRSPRGFDHLTQTTVIDADGVVYRQVYGELFPVPALVEPLKELTYGRRAEATSLAGWISGVKLFCTVYDPASGRYKFDYSIFIGIAIGVVCLGGIAVFLARAWRESGRAGA